MAVSFIGGGNWSARRKLPTCHKSLTNFYHIMYLVHLAMSRIRTHNFSSDIVDAVFPNHKFKL